MLFGSAELEVRPTVLAAPTETSADGFLLAPLTPPSNDQEAAEVGELRKDVEFLAQQLAAALLMLNTLSVSAAVATEAAQPAVVVIVAAAAAATAQVQAQFALLNPLPVLAAVEALSIITVQCRGSNRNHSRSKRSKTKCRTARINPGCLNMLHRSCSGCCS